MKDLTEFLSHKIGGKKNHQIENYYSISEIWLSLVPKQSIVIYVVSEIHVHTLHLYIWIYFILLNMEKIINLGKVKT